MRYSYELLEEALEDLPQRLIQEDQTQPTHLTIQDYLLTPLLLL
jgi:hypothetical protein